jgi:hypothetical protein
MMSDNLNDFLIALASDPDQMARFTIDPEGEFEKASLTPDERAAILANDPERLRSVLGASRAYRPVRVLRKKKRKVGKKRKPRDRKRRRRPTTRRTRG